MIVYIDNFSHIEFPHKENHWHHKIHNCISESEMLCALDMSIYEASLKMLSFSNPFKLLHIRKPVKGNTLKDWLVWNTIYKMDYAISLTCLNIS